ncbi:unnamed protein product [Ilex paraguariensis]|uniref:RNase H type-1 domain-containing protein n=1 Tax=Ilex paraguariensis TaxID=185542 RepID=A0ABC8RUS6_9AQUA
MRSVALVLFWQIWKERCRRVSGEGSVHCYAIFMKIHNILRYQVRNIKLTVQDDGLGKSILKSLQIVASVSIWFRCVWVKWTAPSVGIMKLNTDGDAKNNSGIAGGGAVLRNDKRNVVLASSFFYNECSNKAAEFRALYDGLHLIWQYDLSCYRFVIECDSLVLVNSILGLCACP